MSTSSGLTISTSADSAMSAAMTGAGAALDQPELDRVRREALEAELLDVQDDLGDVFLDARDRGELLVHVADLDRRDGRALERGEQDAAEGVAEGDAVAGLQRPGLVLGVRAGFRDGLDLRGLEFDHGAGATSSSTRPRAAR